MNLGPAIILIVIAAIAGYVIGIVDSRITNSLLKKKQAEATLVDNTGQPGNDESNVNGEHTVLKVTIDKALKWHLELDGTRFENPGEITTEQRQRVVSVVVQMRPWLDGKAAPAAQSNPIADVEKVVIPTPPVSTPVLPASKTPATLTKEQAPAAKDPLKIDAMRGLRSLLNNEVKAPGDKKGLSIVAMIDEVLQAKLLGTPLMEKVIRLEDGPMGQVIVCVGSNRYEGVGEVTNPEIRDIIKEAIAEWEKK
ncbi:MAG: hypothetical protein WCK35_00265 [Chloroflexota bacterium]